MPNTIWGKSQNCGEGTDLYLSFLQLAFYFQLYCYSECRQKNQKHQKHNIVNATKCEASKKQKATAENPVKRMNKV